jgi:hypothetical protein
MTPVEAVLGGLYDAAVVSEKRFREVAAEHRLMELGRFTDSGDLIVAKGDLPQDKARDFQRALIELKQSGSAQNLFGTPARFRLASESDYREIEKRLEAEKTFDE